jgi:hypothetical protein
MSAAPLPPLNRRHWLTLALGSLSGCGGGDISTAGTPGTGGTGMYAVGSIQGFGSVIVNGIKFDDTQASIVVNGLTLTSAALRLGMVAQVHGERSSTATLGTASQIAVWSIAQGSVSSVSSTQCTVAGMTLRINSNTVFDGVSAATLTVGQTVTVWGLQADSTATVWTASRITLTSASTVVSTGLLQRTSGGQTHINGLTLSGDGLDSVSSGSLLWVEGQLSGIQQLQVSRSVLLDTGLPRSGEAEVEGMVTAVSRGQRFTLGTVPVDASALTLSSPVAVGQRLEVSGQWQNGTLIATKLELEDEDQPHDIEIQAPIQSYTSLSDFVVRSQHCNASSVTQIGNGSAADLKVGVVVKVKGTLSGNVLIVTELEIEN